jgi:hypothetical protein
MPSSPNSLVSSLTPGVVNNPKRVNISKAENGFMISLQKTDSYGEMYKVAKEVSEIADIVTAYFAG